MYAAHAVLRILHLLFEDTFLYTGLYYVEFWKDMGQYGCSETPAFYPVGTRDTSPRGKAAGAKADHSPPSSDEVKNAWSYTSIPQYVFMAWCLVKLSGFHITTTFCQEITNQLH
jgi:hypothetical protein